MPRERIYNFHDARLSLVQSRLREVIAEEVQGGPEAGLCAGRPIQQAASEVLDAIDKGTIADAASARAAYRSRRTALGAPMSPAPEAMPS